MTRKLRRLVCLALAGAGVLGGSAAGIAVFATGGAAAAPKPSICQAQSAPSFTPDPVLGAGASQYFGDAEMATIPSTASTIGIPDPTSTTGTVGSPITGENFAAAYLDETELYEYLNNSTSGANPAGSPGAYDAGQPPILNSLPSGTVSHLSGSPGPSPSTGAGLPYAAILSSDLKTVIGTAPVTITDESYTVDPSAWMPGAKRQPPSSCDGPHYAAMTFSASGVSGLTPGTTYAAYLLVRDTDVSGPLANHIWYFTPPQHPAPEAFVGYADSYRNGSGHPSPWQGDSGVTFEGCNYFTPTHCTKAPGKYDAGAIRFVNHTGSTLTFTHASVKVGSCNFRIWPGLNVHVPDGGQLILTQTGGRPPCHTQKPSRSTFNFDASETSKSCNHNDGKIPVVTVTINGVKTTYHDTNQIINTGGVDPGAKTCGKHNETTGWQTLGP